MKKLLATVCLLNIISITHAQNGNVGIGTLTPPARQHVMDSNVLFTAAANIPGIAGNPAISGTVG